MHNAKSNRCGFCLIAVDIFSIFVKAVKISRPLFEFGNDAEIVFGVNIRQIFRFFPRVFLKPSREILRYQFFLEQVLIVLSLFYLIHNVFA